VAGKWLELLKEIAPRVARVAFLFNPKTAPYAEYYLKSFRTAAASFAVEAIAAPCNALPAVYPFHYWAEVGGLLSYGSEQIDNFRRAATYVDRILRGDKPADLPVQAPVKYVLEINLKTAKALGLDVPPSLLARADEVIE